MSAPRAGPRSAAVLMFGVLLASYVVNAMDRQLFPLLAPEVRRQYGFSLASVGFLATVFTFGMAVAGLPTGYLLARLSRKTVLQTGIALFSAATILTPMADGFTDMLLYRAATGIGEAMQLTVLLAIGASYFVNSQAAAIGSVNCCFAIGAIASPVLGGALLSVYHTWRVPMVVFGLLGFAAMAVIGVVVKRWLTEHQMTTTHQTVIGGASTLANRNTLLLTIMSIMGGLVIYGYLGMYPTFLREGLGYTPTAAGVVMGTYGFGALASIGGGWLGDRFSPRVVLATAFWTAATLGYLLFHGSRGLIWQSSFSFAWGVVVSGVIYVNLAGYHVKAVDTRLAGRGSGLFVSTLYGSAAVAGYLMGWIVSRAGWEAAGAFQISMLSIVAGVLALALRPADMTRGLKPPMYGERA